MREQTLSSAVGLQYLLFDAQEFRVQILVSLTWICTVIFFYNTHPSLKG